ncbi:MAG: hypothetical protein AAGB31_16400, partial [Bdellovibrio sp.]
YNEPLSTEESAFVRDIESTLSPDFKKPVLKITGSHYDFKSFQITPLGSETNAKAPSSLSLSVDRFRVKDGQGSEQTLEVVSGQVPPQPLKFEVKGEKYTLVTYQTETGFRLYPYYFQIFKGH